MTESLPDLGRLEEVSPRTAWSLEDVHFTPWLANNLDRLSSEIGIELELEATEHLVGPFRADILARDVRGDRFVLIENQLASGDHKHLGQIMTYLAGLETQVMIWIATSFTDEHLSAVHWLNTHTVEPFSFFAVKVRVVRIGDSQMAPLFEVLEKPNNWERSIQEEARAITGQSPLGRKRRQFWSRFVEAHPEENESRVEGTSSRWRTVSGAPDFIVSQYLSKNEVGIFIRPPKGEPPEHILDLIQQEESELERQLGVSAGPSRNGHFFVQKFSCDTDDEANWPGALDWLHDQTDRYIAALEAAFGDFEN